MTDELPIEELERLAAEYKRLQQNGAPPLKRQDAHEALLDFASHLPQFIAAARERDSLAAQLATIRAETVEECAKAICPLCRDGVELVPIAERHYGGWHQISDLGGAPDGGTDYEECKAERIRSLTGGSHAG